MCAALWFDALPSARRETNRASASFPSACCRGPRTRADELEWLRRAGPWSSGLIDFIRRQHKSYDVLVFFSLCSPITVNGAAIAPERSIIFPYLQLQPALRFDVCAEILSTVRGVGLVSGAERRLLRSYVRATPQHEELVGIGIDPLPSRRTRGTSRIQPTPSSTTKRSAGPAMKTSRTGVVSRAAAVCRSAGAIDSMDRSRCTEGGSSRDNGCEEMLDYFDTFAASDGDTTLALMGVKMMKVPGGAVQSGSPACCPSANG